jgi:indole-3-glycerol phosphate synthase
MILDDIVANKHKEIIVSKRRIALVELKRRVKAQSPPLDFTLALSGGGLKLITEVKKASPSKGIIRQDFDAVRIARIYADNGATAISVLTDEKFFQGKLEYLSAIRQAFVNIPILRKDFILDPYQVFESRAYGADAILLIVAILSPDKLKELLKLSYSLGMACLVEVHNEDELNIALQTDARIIGINNRDLTTMTTDISTTERLQPLISASRLIVSESGIKDHRDMARLERLGINAVLVGESLMDSPDIVGKMKELLGQG